MTVILLSMLIGCWGFSCQKEKNIFWFSDLGNRKGLWTTRGFGLDNWQCETLLLLQYLPCEAELHFELPHDKTSKMSCARSKDSDQPGRPPSLIRVYIVRMKKHWALNYLLSAQRRLIRLGRCTGWSESSLGAHVILLVLSCGGSFCIQTYIELK